MIQTERLLLRRARLDDTQDLFDVFRNPLAMRYWDSLPHSEIAQTRRWLEEKIMLPPEQSDDFVIERNGRVIGKVGCFALTEIGFILHPDHWGQGLAHEALSVVIPHNFATLPISVLTADVDPRNKACFRLLARHGFHETGRAANTVKLGDEWCDSIYLALPSPWSVTRESLKPS